MLSRTSHQSLPLCSKYPLFIKYESRVEKLKWFQQLANQIDLDAIPHNTRQLATRPETTQTSILHSPISPSFILFDNSLILRKSAVEVALSELFPRCPCKPSVLLQSQASAEPESFTMGCAHASERAPSSKASPPPSAKQPAGDVEKDYPKGPSRSTLTPHTA